jgi:hypothetical protein
VIPDETIKREMTALPGTLSPSRLRPTLTAAGAALGGALGWWHWGGPAWATAAIVTGALFGCALVLPRLYRPVFRVLDGIVHAFLQAFTWLLLGLVFLLVFVPGRLVLVLRRSDPLERAPRGTRATTAWHQPRPGTDPEKHFRAQF